MHNEGNYKHGKGQPVEWEKIMANKATGQELISKYTSRSCSSIPEKRTNQKAGRRSKQIVLQRRQTDG